MDFFVTDQGGQVEFIQTDSGLVISGRGAAASPAAPAPTPPSPARTGTRWKAGFTPWGLAAVADAGHTRRGRSRALHRRHVTSFGGMIYTRTLPEPIRPTRIAAEPRRSRLARQHRPFPNHGFPGRAAHRLRSKPTPARSSPTSHVSVCQPWQAAIVNGASFAANAAAPGALISIFGDNLATGVAQATATPWPMQLGTTKVLVNGTADPVVLPQPEPDRRATPVNLAAGARAAGRLGGRRQRRTGDFYGDRPPPRNLHLRRIPAGHCGELPGDRIGTWSDQPPRRIPATCWQSI